MRRIDECAEVLPGLSLKVRAKHEPEGTHQVILIKHLTEDVPYVYEQRHHLRITPDKVVNRYLINKGDVLFISRGLRNEAVQINSVPENTVASSSLYIIRGKKGAQTGYLAWILNQPQIRAKIIQARTGAGTPLVQRAELLGMEIPVPDMERQTKIVALNNLMIKERSLRNELFEQTRNLHRAIGQQIYGQIKKD